MKKFLHSKATPYLILFFACLIVLLRSPVAPFSYGVPWTDSSVFMYAAQQMIDGKLIYKEVFDHKGPTLYLLNIIGLKLFNGNWAGIWIIQLLCYLITTTFLYKILRFFYNKRISLLAILTVLLYQGAIEFGGNICETWALPFTSIALYIFTQYFVKQKRFSLVQLFLLSASFILTLFLRPNLVALWGVFGLVVAFDLLQSKRWKEILSYSFFIIVFCLLSILPFFLYAYSKGIIEDSIYAIFTFNIIYLSDTGIIQSVLDTILCTMETMRAPMYVYLIIVFAYISYIVLCFKEVFHKKYAVAVVISIFVIAFSCSIGRPHIHYFVQLAPVLIFPMAACFAFLTKNFPKRKWTFAVFFFLILNCSIICGTIYDVHSNYQKEKRYFYAGLSNLIAQHTTSSDKILVMGNDLAVYLFSNRESSSRYPFIYPIIEKDKKIEEYYFAEFKNNPLPKLIIIDWHCNSFSNDLRSKLAKILQDNYEDLEVQLNNRSYVIWKRN